MEKFIRFLKDWTLPVAIFVGTVCYLTCYFTPALDPVSDAMGPFFDVFFPVCVFLTLLITFCKVDFHQMLPHRWQFGVLGAQLLLIALKAHSMGRRADVRHCPMRLGCSRSDQQIGRQHQYDYHLHHHFLAGLCPPHPAGVPHARERRGSNLPGGFPGDSAEGGHDSRFAAHTGLYHPSLPASAAPVDYLEAEPEFLHVGRFAEHYHGHHREEHRA